MTAPLVVDGRIVCDAVAASCRCREDHGHYPGSPHACPCGGSWRGEMDTDSFEIVALPPFGSIRPDLKTGGVW